MTSRAPSISRPSTELEALAQQFGSSRAAHSAVRTASPSPVAAQGPDRTLLLTGAAGFLGTHLLAQLAATRHFDRVVVIVRDKSRLLRQLEEYAISLHVLEHVTILEGDLRTLPLGDFPDVDVVLHSAARIHGLKTLNQLWADNVEVTDRILARYAATAQVHIVSTLSVFVSSNLAGEHLPDPLLVDPSYELYGGYAQSKYVCERMADAAGANIIRLGLLTGSSKTGRFPPGDFFTTVLRTLHELHCAPPEFAEALVDVTPVDFAAARIVQLLARGAPAGAITHIANNEPVRLTQILEHLAIARTTLLEFRRRLRGLPRMQRVLVEYAFFKQASLHNMPEFFNIDLFQTTGHKYGPLQPFSVSSSNLLSLYVAVAGLN